VRDEYNLDFLELTEKYSERELEEGLIKNILKFLAEVGPEFCFIGRQHRLAVNDKEFFVDLLFYHRGLKSLVAIELKTVEFAYEHVGKMLGYLAMLDDKVKKEDENPSIGIVICKTKDRTIVEYALNGISRPVGVATYTYKDLPNTIAKYLPSDEAFARGLEDLIY
jgi:hypothetical protein